MPALITLPLLSDHPDSVTPNPARALQAIVYDWFRQADPELARQVHDQSSGAKPYAFGWERDHADGGLHWSLALLDDEIIPALTAVILDSEKLDLTGSELRIDQENLVSRSTSYQELVDASSVDTLIPMHFLSPTSFRSGGLVYPLPEPFKCWQSWLSRWNAFAPSGLTINVVILDVVQAHVAVNRYDLRTEALRFEDEDRYQIGFTGSVTFAVTNSHLLDKIILRQLNVLADYATFCGTGHATPRGLGQTRRLTTRKTR